ncbi:MAG: YicC/YloC family endoribonuclease [Alphaproteobacteria bacterium]|nr:YicC/YloC family endoribonuclease [Alphaproteobacteria bacterium]
MTGFARCQGHHQGHDWVWEIKSVNNRGLDLRCRLGQGNDALEPELRRRLSEHVTRGSISVGLVARRAAAVAPMRLNRAFLTEMAAETRALADELALPPPGLDALMALPGAIEPEAEQEDAVEARHAAMLTGFDTAVAALCEARRDEGARLAEVLEALLAEIADGTEQAAASAEAQPAALRARLEAQLGELSEAVPALPEERLAQEVALLAAKADIREEIDRLHAHVAAARDLLAEGGAIGRRLDFLCQEFNREANTLCSKSSDVALTAIGLDLKAAVDRLREQVQNVE